MRPMPEGRAPGSSSCALSFPSTAVTVEIFVALPRCGPLPCGRRGLATPAFQSRPDERPVGCPRLLDVHLEAEHRGAGLLVDALPLRRDREAVGPDVAGSGHIRPRVLVDHL